MCCPTLLLSYLPQNFLPTATDNLCLSLENLHEMAPQLAGTTVESSWPQCLRRGGENSVHHPLLSALKSIYPVRSCGSISFLKYGFECQMLSSMSSVQKYAMACWHMAYSSPKATPPENLALSSKISIDSFNWSLEVMKQRSQCLTLG